MPRPPLLPVAALACGLWSAAAAGQIVPELPDPSRPLGPLEALPADPAPAVAAPTEGDVVERRSRLRLEGVEAPGVAERFREQSAVERGESQPSTRAQIERRLADDAALLRQLLRDAGFRDAEVTTALTFDGAGRSEADALLRVERGQRYPLAQVTLPPLPADLEAAVRGAFGLTAGAPADGADVAAAVERVRVLLPERGYPFARVEVPEIVVDRAARTASLALTVEPGPRATFAGVRVEGPRIVSDRHVASLARFRPGEPYDARLVEDLRRALVQTGLFGAIRIRPERAAGPPSLVAGATAAGSSLVAGATAAAVDVVVAVERAPVRTVALAGGYSTGQGVRVEASWQHRNLLPPEGGVTLRGVGGTREQALAAELRRRNWRERDRTLVARAALSNQLFDAFSARTLEVAGSVERETNIIWQKAWYWSAGGQLLASDERDRSARGLPGGGERRTYLIAAVPLSLSYDGTDDLLDPTTGGRLAVRASPELSLRGAAYGYARLQLDGSAYLRATPGLVLAGRVRVATIQGAAREDIAPSRRLYAGGGGSVRGYDFQGVGPRSADGTPTGGRGLIEASAEARVRFGSFGLVPFVDVGQLSQTGLPPLGRLRAGAGLGFRYYTGFGPIRLDVATPIAKRATDPRVAFYVSIGQAF